MTKRIMACLSVAVAVAVTMSACAAEGQQAPGSTAIESGQPDESRTAVELAVLEALEYDSRPKAARYEPEADRIVVTVYASGEDVSAEEVQAYETEAEQVTDGIDVVVEVTDDDPPVEN